MPLCMASKNSICPRKHVSRAAALSSGAKSGSGSGRKFAFAVSAAAARVPRPDERGGSACVVQARPARGRPSSAERGGAAGTGVRPLRFRAGVARQHMLFFFTRRCSRWNARCRNWAAAWCSGAAGSPRCCRLCNGKLRSPPCGPTRKPAAHPARLGYRVWNNTSRIMRLTEYRTASCFMLVLLRIKSPNRPHRADGTRRWRSWILYDTSPGRHALI